MGPGQQPAQVAIPTSIAGQKDQVIAVLQSHFRPADRLDAGPGCRPAEFDGGTEVVVIGNGQGGHIQLGRALHQLVDTGGTVQKRKRGVHMEVRKHRPSPGPGKGSTG